MVEYRIGKEQKLKGSLYKQVILHSKEENILLFLTGYKKAFLRDLIFNIFGCLTLGVLFLISTWSIHVKLLRYVRCKLADADFIRVSDNLNQTTLLEVQTVDVYRNNDHQHLRFIVYQNYKFIWNDLEQKFSDLSAFYRKYTLKDIHSDEHGLSETEALEQLKLFGANRIEIEIKPYWDLFWSEVFSPLYVFQIFSVILWSFDEYYEYATCIVFISAYSIWMSLQETRQESLGIKNLVEHSNSRHVEVLRKCTADESALIDANDSAFRMIESHLIVPGDVICVPRNGFIVPCDAVLLVGNCIVNESMLTGESVPVTKTAVTPNDELFNPEVHKRHTMFAGTQVLQTRYYENSKVLALVVRTGFETSKGELIQSILYPKPIDFKLHRDSLKFVLILAILATVGMMYSFYIYYLRGSLVSILIIRVLDIVTIVVPPALPAAMTLGIMNSRSRLKKLKIFSTSPRRINVAGKTKLVCFDKTGTLTDEGLKFYGVIPAQNNHLTGIVTNLRMLDEESPLMQSLATCHSLTRLNGEICGDPLDLQMFCATNWVLEEPSSNGYYVYDAMIMTTVHPPGQSLRESIVIDENFKLPFSVGVIKEFPFSSSVQSMSVIGKASNVPRGFTVYTKGAPEKIQKICDPATVPDTFPTVLRQYAQSGYRVIALAYKMLDRKINASDVRNVSRADVECGLTFLGFLVMQNPLKAETTPSIKELKAANLRTVMITGDNILTAISVARDCCMVQADESIIIVKCANEKGDRPRLVYETMQDSKPLEALDRYLSKSSMKNCKYHLAMDGDTWSVAKTHYEDLIPALIVKGTIFARFGPEQKAQLIMDFQELDYIVTMVGDGANDCGALKAAHIGISLSETEASVAAPFTSSIQNISCVKHIILEGRCALVTSFSLFKFMTLYSFIQFFATIVLYEEKSLMGNIEFLYVDLVVTTTLAIGLGKHAPSTTLIAKRPMGSLVSWLNIIPLFMQITLCSIVQLSVLQYLHCQYWFEPIEYLEDPEGLIVCWENTVVFDISVFQYLILAFVYARGKPFRKGVTKNQFFMITLQLLLISCIILTVFPFNQLGEWFELIPSDHDTKDQRIFRYSLLLFPLLHFFLAIFIEAQIAETAWLKTIIHTVMRKREPKNKFKRLERQLNKSNWLLALNSPFDSANC